VLIAGTGVVALAIGADGALRTADGWAHGLETRAAARGSAQLGCARPCALSTGVDRPLR